MTRYRTIIVIAIDAIVYSALSTALLAVGLTVLEVLS